MPVVPPPPPGKAPDAQRGTVFPLFPSRPPSFYIGALSSICPSICSSPSRFLPSHTLSFSFSLARSLRTSSLPTLHPLLSPLRSRSRVITLLLSDMSLCYRHNQPTLFPLCSSSRVLTRWATLFAALPRRVICNVSYARASPRSSAISAIILIFMPTPSPLLSPRHILSRFLSLSPSAMPRGGKANRKQIH